MHDNSLGSVRARTNMLRSIVVGVAALVATIGPASATLYNFDMTGLTPSPVYDSVDLNYSVNLGGGFGGVFCEVYSGLDGTGGTVNGCAKIDSNPLSYSDAAILDGIFSLNLVASGDITVDIPYVVGIKNRVRTEILFGRSVPEPATLALLGLALAGLGISRRRKLN